MANIIPSKTSPTGGWLAWSQVIACFFILMCSLGLANAFGSFQSFYEANPASPFSSSHVSHSTIAWIGTTQGFLLNIFGLLSGRLHDAGHTAPLLLVGSALNVAGLISASFAKQYYQVFLSLGVCVGIGSGLFYVPSLAIVAGAFNDKMRPLATGIAATGAGVGGVVYPVLFRGVMKKFGFEWAVRAFGLVNALALGVGCLLVCFAGRIGNKDNQNRGGGGHGEEHESGYTSGSSTESDTALKNEENERRKKKRQLLDTAAFRDVPFILFSASLFLLWLGVDIPFFFLPSFSRDKLGLDAQWGDYLLSIMNGSAIVGRVLLGLGGVWQGAFTVWQFSIGASLVVLACWVAVKSFAGIVVFVVIYGGLTGGVISLVSSALLVISPDLTVVGTRLGMSGVLAGLGFLVGPPIAGAIQATPAGFIGQCLFAAGTYLAAFGVLCIARLLHKRAKRAGRNEVC